jgi:predicted nucleic acid-binding Zn ribbon protein
MSFSSSKDLARSALMRAGILDQVHIALALECAHKAIEHALGAHIARHMKPISLQHKTLGIAVAHAAAAAHLGMHRETILAKINETFPGYVERIRLVHTPLSSYEPYVY